MGSKQIEILVLDDFLAVIDILDYTLSNGYGMKVYKADSTNLAFDILNEHSGIKVALLDIRLYGGAKYQSTLSFCQRARDRMPCMILIAMTGYASINSLREARVAGFDDYITKPFKIKEIAKMIDENLNKIGRWEQCVGDSVKNINVYKGGRV